MSETDSPLRRSIGVSGVIRWIIAVAAVAFSYRAWQARQAANASPQRPL